MNEKPQWWKEGPVVNAANQSGSECEPLCPPFQMSPFCLVHATTQPQSFQTKTGCKHVICFFNCISIIDDDHHSSHPLSRLCLGLGNKNLILYCKIRYFWQNKYAACEHLTDALGMNIFATFQIHKYVLLRITSTCKLKETGLPPNTFDSDVVRPQFVQTTSYIPQH